MNEMATVPLKFGVAQSVPRKEDPKLVRGNGRYTDDVTPAGTLHAALLRSPWAHARLLGVDIAAARAAPGVEMVITGADLAEAGYGSMPCAAMLTGHDGRQIVVPPFPALATDRVRWVGQPIAMIVAATPEQAREAAELVAPEVEELPAVGDAEAALAEGAPQLFEEMPGNLAVDWRWGDAAKVAEAFARAAHVTRLRVVNNRVVVNAMEPRGAVARFEDGRWLVHAGCQGVYGLRQQLAAAMKVEPEAIRVQAEQIGGSFGMKASIFPEYVPLLHAAKALGRPVKWINDRSESFLSDYHGRDSVMEGALALDGDGNILAVDVKGVGSLGAYVTAFGPAVPTMVIQKNLPSAYRVPVMAMAVRCAVSNTVPTTAYRGAGRPEAAYLMERLVETAARETGRDPIAFRRRNLVRPEEMPYEAASGLTYDSGDFPAALEMGLERAGWKDLDSRRKEAAARGRLLGFGLSCYAEVTAGQGKEMGGISFNENGRVQLTTGTLDYGQGHASPFAQLLSERLGVPFESIDLLQGDSDQLLFGGGTGGSRSMMASGAAILQAVDAVVANGKKLSAHVLEAAEADMRFEAGRFTVAGTDRSIGIMDLARQTATMSLPEDLPKGLDASLVAETPPSTFPNGCHVAEVEIDPDTGTVELKHYVAIDDFGVLVNPMLVEGQVHGGVVQGLGQALLEHTAYDEAGQLLSGSLMDYALPRADDVPDFELDFIVTPATTNPLGVKGCGEAGITAAPPAVMNAIVDALAPLGVRHLDMPATPLRVWQAIREARRTAA